MSSEVSIHTDSCPRPWRPARKRQANAPRMLDEVIDLPVTEQTPFATKHKHFSLSQLTCFSAFILGRPRVCLEWPQFDAREN